MAICVVVVAACGGDPPRQLRIGTGPKGGVFIAYGTGLARQINKSVDGYHASAELTSGAVDNLLRLADGRVDLAITSADAASDAILATGTFTDKVPAQAIARLFGNAVQIVTRPDGGVHTVADLKGRRVSVGPSKSGTEMIAVRLLQAAGLDPSSDIEREQLGAADAADALRDGKLDAFFWSSGLPTSAVAGLAKGMRVALVPTDEYVQTLQQRYGQVYTTTTIKAGTYEGVTHDVPTISVATFLVVNRSMDADLAYRLTRMLFEHKAELAKAHPEAANLDVVAAQEVAPLELHPGAQRYFDRAAT